MSDLPLVVDLDGTLLNSDFAVETLAYHLKASFFRLPELIPALLSGRKAAVKSWLVRDYNPNLSHLPWNQPFIDWLKEEKNRGRQLILATGTHEVLAGKIAEHFGLFDQVLATTDAQNLTGSRKCQALVDQFGEQGFDYAGNAKVDLKVWKSARRAIVVNASKNTLAQARQVAEVERVFEFDYGLKPKSNSLRSRLMGFLPPNLQVAMKAMRVYQWSKNALLFIPLLAVHSQISAESLIVIGFAFLAWGLCASSVYLLNDLLDLDDDRDHPTKCHRPLAAGTFSAMSALLLTPGLLLVSFAIAFSINLWFVLVLACYYLLTMLYSFKIKQIAVLDVVTLSGLYTSRIIGGAAASMIAPSMWLLALSMFIFLSLAMVKRCAELRAKRAAGKENSATRGYQAGDLEVLEVMGSASGYIAVLVMALYASSQKVVMHFDDPRFVWLICPILLYWVSRVWLLTHRGQMDQDPIIFATKDRPSLISCAIIGGIYMLAV